MLAFSQPIMLWGLVALVAPVIIHLFSRSQHKQVLFSTLAFFPKKLPINRKQIKLTQRRLLLLRLLLITAVTLLLAGIHFADGVAATNRVHLVTDDWLASANQQQRNELIAQLGVSDDGEEAHLVALNSSRKLSVESLTNLDRVNDTGPVNVWHQVAEWVQQNSTDNPDIVVHTTNRLSQFVGDPLTIPQKVSWSVIAPATTGILANDVSTLTVLLISDREAGNSTAPAIQRFIEELGFALEALDQATSITIEVKRSAFSVLKATDFEQVNAVVLLDDNEEGVKKVNPTQWLNDFGVSEKDISIVTAAQLMALQGADFSYLLAETLFQHFIDKHYWRDARVSEASIANTLTGKALLAESSFTKPLDISIRWLLLCVLLFVGERWLSETLASPSRSLPTDD